MSEVKPFLEEDVHNFREEFDAEEALVESYLSGEDTGGIARMEDDHAWLEPRRPTAADYLVLNRTERPSTALNKWGKGHDGGDTEFVKDFIVGAKAFGLLDKDEEKTLGTLIQRGRVATVRLQAGDYNTDPALETAYLAIEAGTKARQVMRNCNQLLVVAHARKRHAFFQGRIPVADYIQEGLLGIDKAITTFDPRLGVPFGLHARSSILNSMRNYERFHADVVRLPARLHEKLTQYRQRTAMGMTEIEIVENLKLSPEEQIELREIYNGQQTLSLDFEVKGCDGATTTRHELIEYADIPFLDEAPENRAQVGPVYLGLLRALPASHIWAAIERRKRQTMDSTDYKRAARFETVIKHPAVQHVLSKAMCVETPWQEALCTDDPKKVLRAKAKEQFAQLCASCVLLEKCQNLVEQEQPVGGVWAGVVRTKQSYGPNGEPAVLNVQAA